MAWIFRKVIFNCWFSEKSVSRLIVLSSNTRIPVGIVLGSYSRRRYDISWAYDWSRWPSRPILSLRYIVSPTRIRALDFIVSYPHCASVSGAFKLYEIEKKIVFILNNLTNDSSTRKRDVHRNIYSVYTVLNNYDAKQMVWIKPSLYFAL